MTERSKPSAEWETRAAEQGKSLQGVLFRGLPPVANRALDRWHLWLPRLPLGASLLDFGCGYGRLSGPALRERPDLSVFGQDFALTYCRLFRAEVAPAVQADIAAPPVRAGALDAVMAVTALMYCERARMPAVLAGLIATLKPGGLALLVDPGAEAQQLARRWWPPSRASGTAGAGFARAEYRQLVEQAGFRILAAGGNLRFSLAAPLLVTLGRFAPFGHWLARLVGARDQRLGGYSRLALHRWLLLEKAGSAASERGR
jgi:SAM-dependent methyltransferase